MTRRRIITNGEQDVHTRWRRYYCYLRRAGVTSKIKRLTRRRRERREGRDETES
jgi:hypothetical protein